MKAKFLGVVLAMIVALSGFVVASASEDLVECPYKAGLGHANFVNANIKRLGKTGKVWRVHWDAIEFTEFGDDDTDWYSRVRAFELAFAWVNRDDPSKFGKITLPPIEIGTMNKGRHKLLSMDQPGYVRFRTNRALKDYHARWATYKILCTSE